jgi:hypothetical protein
MATTLVADTEDSEPPRQMNRDKPSLKLHHNITWASSIRQAHHKAAISIKGAAARVHLNRMFLSSIQRISKTQSSNEDKRSKI